MTMKLFEPADRSCVVVGSLNPGIIQPGWLAKHGIASPEAEWELGLEFGAPTPAFSDDHFHWSCKHNRLVVSSVVDKKSDPGEMVARVLEILSHTPITAIGNNIAYTVTSENLQQLLAPLAEPGIVEELGEEPSTYSSTITLSRNEAVLNMKFDGSGSSVGAVAFNYHRPCAPGTGSASAVASARRWSDDERDSRSFMERLAGLLQV